MRAIVLGVGLLAGVASVAVGLYRAKPAVVVPSPSGVLAGVSAADAAIIRSFYEAMADIVVRDGKAKEPVCRTVFDLRNRHKYALSMAFENTGMAGKYAGLGDRLDQYLLAAIGDKDVPLTPDLRRAASAAFAAIK